MKHNRKISKTFVHVAGAVILTTASNAAVLAQYTISGGSLNASGVDPAVSATTITNLNPDGFQASSGASQLFIRADLTPANSLSSAITDNDYVQFTIQPTGANVVSLQSISFDHFGSVNMNAGAFSSSLSVFASIAGVPAFTAGNELGTSTVAVANSNTGNPVLRSADATFNLGPAFQNLTSASTVTFRIYGFDDAGDVDQITRFNDVKINGEVVPEPSTALLCAVGALALLRRRRRA